MPVSIMSLQVWLEAFEIWINESKEKLSIFHNDHELLTSPKALFLHFTGIKFRRSNLKTSDEMMSDELQNKDYL